MITGGLPTYKVLDYSQHCKPDYAAKELTMKSKKPAPKAGKAGKKPNPFVKGSGGNPFAKGGKGGDKPMKKGEKC